MNVSVLFVRPAGMSAPLLERRLGEITAHHGLALYTMLPQDVPKKLASSVGAIPVVLIVSGGKLVGQAVGECLPVRELDNLVRAALDGR